MIKKEQIVTMGHLIDAYRRFKLKIELGSSIQRPSMKATLKEIKEL